MHMHRGNRITVGNKIRHKGAKRGYDWVAGAATHQENIFMNPFFFFSSATGEDERTWGAAGAATLGLLLVLAAAERTTF